MICINVSINRLEKDAEENGEREREREDFFTHGVISRRFAFSTVVCQTVASAKGRKLFPIIVHAYSQSRGSAGLILSA